MSRNYFAVSKNLHPTEQQVLFDNKPFTFVTQTKTETFSRDENYSRVIANLSELLKSLLMGFPLVKTFECINDESHMITTQNDKICGCFYQNYG